jgi:uncharacterized protein
VVIAALELTIAIPAFTLKDKRSVVRRVIARVKGQFNVSAAEVDELDNPDGATLGFVSVGNDKRYLEGQLTALEDFVDRLELAEIIDAHREFIHV